LIYLVLLHSEYLYSFSVEPYVCVCVRVNACVLTCLCVCMCVCVSKCVSMYVCMYVLCWLDAYVYRHLTSIDVSNERIDDAERRLSASSICLTRKTISENK